MVYCFPCLVMVSICFSMLGTVLLYERLYFCRSLALALPRLPFSWGIMGEGDFFYRISLPACGSNYRLSDTV